MNTRQQQNSSGYYTHVFGVMQHTWIIVTTLSDANGEIKDDGLLQTEVHEHNVYVGFRDEANETTNGLTYVIRTQ